MRGLNLIRPCASGVVHLSAWKHETRRGNIARVRERLSWVGRAGTAPTTGGARPRGASGVSLAWLTNRVVGGHGMTWYAFKGLNGGKAVDLAGSQELQATAEGFHGYATEAQAEAQPNAVNLVTQALADAWIADYNAAVKENAQPGGANANILNPATAAKASASYVANSIPGLQQIGNFFSDLGQASTWERVAEVLIGAMLIFAGVSHLFSIKLPRVVPV